jgi:RNA polymerase sigma factor (sigma-70 family)
VTDHRVARVGWPSARLPELEDLDDAALAKQVGRADPAALAVLYRRHSAACQRLARRVTANSVLAEEAVQETFAGLWGNPAAYRPDRGSVRGWLLALTRHKAVDAVRRESAQQGLCHTDPARQPHGVLVRGDPAAAAWEEIRAEMVRSALAALPQAQRQPLALAYFGGYTQREIADLTGVPLGTVKARIYAAMRRLEPQLAGWTGEVTLW